MWPIRTTPFRIAVLHSYACVYLCVYIYICTQILHKAEKKILWFPAPVFSSKAVSWGPGLRWSLFFFFMLTPGSALLAAATAVTCSWDSPRKSEWHKFPVRSMYSSGRLEPKQPSRGSLWKEGNPEVPLQRSLKEPCGFFTVVPNYFWFRSFDL